VGVSALQSLSHLDFYSLELPVLVLHSLQHHKLVRKVVKTGLMALRACLIRCPTCAALCVDHGGDESVLLLQQAYQSDVRLVDYATEIMAKITRNTDQIGESTLKDSPSFTVSLLAAYQEYPSIVKNCSRILGNLIRNRGVLLRMGKLEAVAVIVHSMSVYPDSKCIQKASCCLLAALSCVPDNLEELQQEGAKEALQHAKDRFADDQELKQYLELLTMLTGDSDAADFGRAGE